MFLSVFDDAARKTPWALKSSDAMTLAPLRMSRINRRYTAPQVIELGRRRQRAENRLTAGKDAMWRLWRLWRN
jgi:hypothetical protein